jgi:HrpA-like RNA helicase
MDQSRVWTDAPCVVASFKARELGRTLVYLVLGLLLVALPIITCRVLSRLCRRAKAARKPRYAWTLDDYDALEDEDEDVEVGTRAAASAELDPYSEYMSVKSRKANHVELLHAITKWQRALARRRERADAELTKRIAMAEKVRNSNAGAIAGAPEDAQAAALDRHAPERVEIDTGKKVRIDYTRPEEPSLSVFMQQLFTQKDTPRIAAGRVPLVLTILAPNHRPIQITRDLAGFWKNHYPAIKKEMERRYPRHHWKEMS